MQGGDGPITHPEVGVMSLLFLMTSVWAERPCEWVW